MNCIRESLENTGRAEIQLCPLDTGGKTGTLIMTSRGNYQAVAGHRHQERVQNNQSS